MYVGFTDSNRRHPQLLGMSIVPVSSWAKPLRDLKDLKTTLTHSLVSTTTASTTTSSVAPAQDFSCSGGGYDCATNTGQEGCGVTGCVCLAVSDGATCATAEGSGTDCATDADCRISGERCIYNTCNGDICLQVMDPQCANPSSSQKMFRRATRRGIPGHKIDIFKMRKE